MKGPVAESMWQLLQEEIATMEADLAALKRTAELMVQRHPHLRDSQPPPPEEPEIAAIDIPTLAAIGVDGPFYDESRLIDDIKALLERELRFLHKREIESELRARGFARASEVIGNTLREMLLSGQLVRARYGTGNNLHFYGLPYFVELDELFKEFRYLAQSLEPSRKQLKAKYRGKERIDVYHNGALLVTGKEESGDDLPF